MIYPLGLTLGHFTESIKSLVAAPSPHKTGVTFQRGDSTTTLLDGDHGSGNLRQQTKFHLELSKVVLEMDQLLSFFFLLMYMTDLLGFITTSSLILNHKTGLTSGSIDVELIPVFMALVTVSTLHAVLRTSFGVWLNEKVLGKKLSLADLFFYLKNRL